MTQHNIHGEWTMRFENRILYSVVWGATNNEATLTWIAEMKHLVLSSQEGDHTPWVIINDARNWEMSSLGVGESYLEFFDWIERHNCASYAAVLSKQIQKFSMEHETNTLDALHCFFDYDEAYQFCVEKLAEATT
ncbi:hypothetical protein L4C34_10140 [Vibrio profundum]|uniref:hypothetical protein n=1 Tax=Vibrio profundum TaxID=2910247 RepID=UPI003D11A132